MNRRRISKPRYLTETHPDLAREAKGWDPSTITYGSGKKFEWECSFGHTWLAQVANRATLGSGCPYCVGKKVLVGFNDLQSQNPKLASEAFGWDPSQFTTGSSKKMKWQCSQGHIWTSSINDRNRGYGCPYCDGKKVLSGFNDLMSKHPEIAKEANDWDPSQVHFGSAKRLSWKCKLGHVWKATVSSRVRLNASCPVCSGHKLQVGFNDLQTTHPEIALEAHGWDPTSVQRGSRSLKKWRCPDGHTWVTSVNSRTNTGNGGSNCPSCTIFGFIPDEEGFFYLLEHDEWNLRQIGITNKPKQRLASHKKLGWQLLDLLGPLDGLYIQELEKAVLKMLKDSGAQMAPLEVAGNFDGYTESWIANSYRVNKIEQLLKSLKEFENR